MIKTAFSSGGSQGPNYPAFGEGVVIKTAFSSGGSQGSNYPAFGEGGRDQDWEREPAVRVKTTSELNERMKTMCARMVLKTREEGTFVPLWPLREGRRQ